MLSARRVLFSSSRVPTVAALALLGLAVAAAPPLVSGLMLGAAIPLVLVFAKVEYGLYLLAFAVPFGFTRELTVESAAVSPTDGLIAVLLLSWLFKVVATRQTRVPCTYVLVALGIFLAAALPSALFAPSLPLVGKEVVKWIEFAVVYVVAADMVSTRSRVLLLLFFLFIAGSLEALYGLYQFLFHVGPPGFLVGGRFIRSFGTFGQPNPFAAYLGLVLPIACGALLGMRRPEKTLDYVFLVVAAVTFVVCFVALVTSMSRGAWLGVGAALALMIVVASRRALVLSLPILIVLGLVTVSGLWDRLPTSIADRTTAAIAYFRIFDARTEVVTPQNYPIVERMADWQSAWEMFTEKPLFGIGFGNYIKAYPDYALPLWQNALAPHAHNYYLNILAEGGALGFVGYMIFLAALSRAAISAVARHIRKRRTAHEWHVGPLTGFGLTLGIGGMLVVLLVHSLFDNLYVHSMTAQVGLMFGLLPTLDS